MTAVPGMTAPGMTAPGMTAPGGAVQAPRLRRLRWWDVARVLPVERLLFGATAWTAESFWSELADPGTRWYVVAEDGRGGLLGYAGLMVTGAEADVQTVAVAPGGQGRGIGRRLLAALLAEADRRGATSAMLEVRADNPAAIGLYARAGFEQIAVRRRYYQPDDVDALIMRLRPLRPSPAPSSGAGSVSGAGSASS